MSTELIAVKYVGEHKHKSWPKEMGSKPVVGDRVRSESGEDLRISLITHTTYKDSYNIKHPILEILLAR